MTGWRRVARWLPLFARFVVVAAGAALAGCGGGEGSNDAFEVAFIDVGQGDATLITSDGQRLLVDGGRSKSRIRERLEAMAVTDLDAIVATHSDADHIAGLIEVLEMYTVERIYLNGDTSESQTYANFMAAVEAEGAQVVIARRGMAIALGDLAIEVLHPVSLTGDLNEDAIVLDWQCGTASVMLMADATIASEASMLAAGVVRDIDLLKLGHHGSDTSTSQGLLDATTPARAVVSAGLTNSYGHPHASVISRVTGTGASIYYTDTSGGNDTVVITSDCDDGWTVLGGAASPAASVVAPTGVR